jgi:hypothetical protein
MPLAAPLILPFAELAGITIAGLGMAAASKKVSDFISDNPEISTQILTTLVPGGVGLNALFKDKDAPSTKDIVLGELGKEKGNYSSPDAEGAYSSKRGRIIKALEEAGKIKKGPDKDYDSSKKYKGYKKFYEKADGGAIGIEVLFEEKKDGGRIGFANGGIENIIGKNLDNVTNVAKGLDKEMLDMTFDDKYYRDVIQPAKLGQAPIPGRMEMMLKSKPFTAVGIGMRPGTFGERAQPTKAASQFLNTLGKGAKFVGTKVGPLSFMDIFASTPLGADDEVTDEMRQSIEMSPTSTTGIMVDANDGFRTSPATYYNSAPNFNADVLREEEDAQYNLPQKNMLQNLKDYLPFIGDKSITGMLTRGIGQFFNNIGDRIPSTPQYQQYTPGYNYGNLNPNLIDDFYDPATGLNRFDRAKTLFGQSRTLSEFLSKRRERAAAEADLVQRREIERKLEREKALTRNTSSNIDYGGFVSGGGTHSSDSSFTGHSSATGGGMGQSGWGGPRAKGGFIGDYEKGGRVGYVGGGLATTQDYATALSKVGAGTQAQKNRQVQDYARSEASNQIANAVRQGGQSSLNSYLTNVFGQTLPSYNATPSGKYANYNSPFTGSFNSVRNIMIDDVARQLVQKQAPSFYVDPKASASEAYGKMMQQKTEEAYGTPDKYRAEAMTLGMPVEAYYDYLTTRDDKNIMQQYRKQDPYFEPSTYVPFTEADRTPSPYDIYLQQILQQQTDAGIPEEGRIRSGEVALPSMISPTTTGAAPRPFMSYSDALAQTRQSLGLADGGLATLFSMKR